MAIEYSPEQTKILEVEKGAFIVVANAGTGKTFSTAELILRRYIYEEKKLFHNPKEHVGGTDQIRLLRQHLPVTFTVKAAAELDAKIKKGFVENGIPLPKNQSGTDYRIARTLDSYLQGWLRHPAIFDAWMATDNETLNRLNTVIAKVPQALLEAMQCPTDERKRLYQFSNAWPWLPSDDVLSMLLDLTLREGFAPLEGCDIAAWAKQYDEMLSTLEFGDGKQLHLKFWDDRIALWKKHHSRIKELDHKLLRGETLPEEEKEKAFALVKLTHSFNMMREEFNSVQELSRARGYHPIYAPEKVTSRTIEEQIAASEHLGGYHMFLDASRRWQNYKTHFMLREFGDQTTSFVRACEAYPELMERDSEYPRMIRRKYVYWDEVQDNSDFQHRILKLFYAKGGKPFLSVAIGDPKQQIYCWRGASPRGFLDMIERKRKKEPEKLLGLTCSFRSAKKIVALGNEIIQTLPSYREKVLPSTTIYKEEGHIEVTRPFRDLDEEADWVNQKVQHYLATTKCTIMIIARSDLSDHPLCTKYLSKHPDINSRINIMTIHKSKGLEADIVFVLGLVAGKTPDIRGNSDEEVNLFYVACTRARHTLILSGLTATRDVNEHGLIEDTIVGPSPYFVRLPTLRALCEAAGWTSNIFGKGLDTHGQKLAVHLAKIDGRRGDLIKERKTLFPTVEVGNETRGVEDDYGAITPSGEIRGMQPRDIEVATGTPGDPNGRRPSVVHLKLQNRVKEKLASAMKMTGKVPRLTTDEFDCARRSGWIMQSSGGHHWTFTDTFKIVAAQPPAQNAA